MMNHIAEKLLHSGLAIRALAIVLVLTFILTGCQSFGTTNPSTIDPSETAGSSETAADLPFLDIYFYSTGQQPAEIGLVEATINQIVNSQLEVNVRLNLLEYSSALQQYNLMLYSKDKVDLMMTYPFTYQKLVAQGRLIEIGPLLDQYGTGIKEVLGNYLAGSEINGKIFGVRPIGDVATGAGIIVMKDVIDQCNLDLDIVKSFADIGLVLDQIKKDKPDDYPLISTMPMTLIEPDLGCQIDRLGDSLGVLMDQGQTMKVVNLYETDLYADYLTTVRNWYIKGYTMPSISTNTENALSLMSSGNGSVCMIPTNPGTSMGFQLKNQAVLHEYQRQISTTTNITMFQWVVPIACESPSKAVKMLNLMFTSADVMNLLAWGVEGRHYITHADGTIGFPQGIDRDTSGYYVGTPWMMGNEFLTKIWNGYPLDLWEQIRKFNNEAIISGAMGFSYDPTPVKTEIVALNNIIGQYEMPLECGAVDPELVLPELITKLKAAGIDRVVAEKQQQLDRWAAMNQN